MGDNSDDSCSRSKSRGRKKDRSGSRKKDRSGSRKKDRSRSGKRDRSRGRSRDRRKDKKKSESRSRSRDEERDQSPKYSPEDNWRRLDNLKSWRGLGKKEKTRPTLTGCEKDDLRVLEKKIQKRLKTGYRSSCIRASLAILEHGFEVPQELLENMLAMVVQRPGIIQIAQTLQLIAINPNAYVGIECFLRGLGVLIQRNAPVQLVRMWLNLGMPRGSRALQYLPHDYDDEEKELAAQDLEDAFGVITDDEEDEKGASRRVMFVTSCKARPEVNGRYERSEDLSAHGRPVYEKVTQRKIVRDPKGKGGGKGAMAELKKLMLPPGMAGEDEEELEDVVVCHYKKVGPHAKFGTTGWYFSRDSCSGFVLASNERSTKGPPTGGWFVHRERTRLPDPLRIVDPSKANEDFRKKHKAEGKRAIEAVHPEKLKGRLQTHDKSIPAAEYFGHFCMLMHLEHMEELRQIKRRNTRLPDMELIRLGWTLDGLPCTAVFGRREPKKVTLLGWEDPGSEMGALVLPPGTEMGRLKFKRGDSVTVIESKQQLRSKKGDVEEKLGDGFVADMRPPSGRLESQLIIRLRGCWPDDAMSRRWRIDKGANSTLYERQLQAMLNLVTQKRPRVSEILITAQVGLADSWSKQWRKGGMTEEDKKKAMLAAEKAEQAALLEGKNVIKQTAKLAKLNPGGTDSEKLDRALAEVKTLTHLNQSQRDAVKSALKSTCTVIQGPPGTGKTHVSVQILKMWSRTLDLSPILATSDSNVAVDNIAMGLIKEGVKAVRVGRPDKINRILEEITLECLMEREKEELGAQQYQARFKSRSRSGSGSPLGRSKKEKSKSKSKERPASRSRSGSAGPRRQKGKAKGRGKGKKGSTGRGSKADFELQMRILQDADVLCTTTISSGGDFFSKFAFAGVLVDEAAQATEMAAIVPLILRGSQRLVLVGDQCQLPPTVQSTEAEERGLSLSLYSRMIDGGGVTPFLLDMQFRSHPMIAEFSSRFFYQGRIKSGVEAKDRKPPRGMPWPRPGCPIAFVDCHGEEDSEGDSKFNPAEADVVLKLVQDAFYQRELEITEIGVVTPYLAQVRLLKRVIKNIIPEGQDPELFEIASVDNFQGREKDLIIFSATRSNRLGTVGFLADWRRLNVMLTRARRGIIIVGNSQTLKVDEHWAKWLDFYARVSNGRPWRSPTPEKKIEHKDETPEEKEARLKKERTEAARKLSMAIRFPGLAMATSEKKDRSRSRSGSPLLGGEADANTIVKGGRQKPRKRTPSPVRPAKVVKEIGVGRRKTANEFERAGAPGQAKAKAKAKLKLSLASSDSE